MEKAIQYIKNYSRGEYNKLKRKGGGYLKHPFLVPGAVYSNQL